MTALRVPLLKQVETLNYRPGGFHPVHLGDQFKKDRYHVIHKLGHGGFATVWLARDLVRKRYVALKILAARLSRDCPEVEILRRIKLAPDDRGKPFVMSMLDHFWINGPNGKHLCVVSQVAGPSIKQFNDCPGQSSGTRRLRAVVARKVALQVTEGLSYIHSTGIVHGDFTSANILLQLANIDEWSEDQIYERLGNPVVQNLHHSTPHTVDSSAPRYTTNAISMKEVDPQFLSDRIMIIDFGIAFVQNDSSTEIGTPKPYCAPEFLFGGARSISSDTWALGCTIFEIRTGSRLFRYKGKPTRNQILIAMVKLMGTLPDQWWLDWESGRDWYAKEAKYGGELFHDILGTLYDHIMDVGIHDGAYPEPTPKDESLGNNEEHDSVDYENLKGSTDRLIEMVGELTTSEAAEVLALVNKSSYNEAGEAEHKSDSVSSVKVESGSGSGSGNKTNSGSSNAKSGEKSISSEGLSTGVASKVLERPAASDPANLIGEDGAGLATSSRDEETDTLVTNFLEAHGTRMKPVEGHGLENLLRKALMYLPEERLPPSELAKHHWFFDEYMDVIVE